MPTTLSGPAASADWQRRPPGPGIGDLAVLTLPDTADPDVLYYVPEQVTLATRPTSGPVLALTLMLDGLPAADESSVVPRINQGLLSCEFTLALAPPPAVPGKRMNALFARPARMALLVGAGTPAERELMCTEATGPEARGALSTMLGREETLAFLSALDDADDSRPKSEVLSLTTRLTYRAVFEDQHIRLYGNWARVYDVLAARHPEGTLTAGQLSDAYHQLIREGTVTVEVESGLDVEEAAEAVFPTFRTIAALALFSEETPDHYQLGRRPSPHFSFDVTKRSPLATERTLDLTHRLSTALGPAREVDRDRLITLVSVTPPVVRDPDSDGADGGTGAVSLPISRTPRRVRSESWADTSGLLALAESASANRWITVGGFLDAPSARPATDAHRLLAIAKAQGVKPVAEGLRRWADGAVLDGALFGMQQLKDLPFVPDGDVDGYLRSARPGRPGYYVPAFTPVRPKPTDTVATSPFVYSYRSTATTATGQPGLEATVTFRLAYVRQTSSRPVYVENLAVGLLVPFRDQHGVTQVERFDATLQHDAGDVVATVRLLDDWARLAYGALSLEGFQSQPVQVDICWSFVGYRLREWDEIRPVFGGKRALLPVVYDVQDRDIGAGDVGGYLDAVDLTYRSALGDYKLHPVSEAPHLVEDDHRPGSSALIHPDVVIGEPQLQTIPIEFDGPTAREEPRYIEEMFVVSRTANLLVPCAEFGSVYAEERPEGLTPIGCRNAMRLGDTSYRQYEEIQALTRPGYRVFRSLQQPGRFLVLPARYLIGRFPVSDPEHAYRPRILVYSVVDATRPTDAQATIEAVLQPDIPPYEWARLNEQLAGYANDPKVLLPTAVDMRAVFTWTVSGISNVRVAAVPAPDGLRASLSTDLAHALLLRDILVNTGVSGTVEFTFPDGSSLSSALLMDLSELTGPPDTGPVQALLDGNRAILANRVERPVTVSDLLVRTAAAQLTQLPVEIVLPAGGSTTVTLPAGTGAHTAWPVYSVPNAGPASLEEIRAFVDDVRTNVVFVDLIDHAAHRLSALDVRARLSGVAGEQDVIMTGEHAVGSAFFVLPLTTYLDRRVLQFTITATPVGGPPKATGWLDWDLAGRGNLVSITPDLLPR